MWSYAVSVPYTFDADAERRRIIRRGRRITARWQADHDPQRHAALEAADWAEEHGMVAEAAVQRQLAEDAIPDQFRWAFEPSADDSPYPAGWREVSTEEWLRRRL